jgi:putative transcriptional regulator
MSAHVDEKLPELVLGGLDDEERRRVETHLDECRRCAAEWLATEEALALFAWSLPAEPAPAEARARLLDATRAEDPVLEKFARLFDLAREAAAALLGKLKTPEGWVPGPFPGMELYHFKAGPTLEGADTGLIRFPGNMTFPLHKHLGDELMLVVEGGFREVGGRHCGVGDQLTMAADTAHSFVMDPEGCVAAVSLRIGIEVDGVGKLYVDQFKK